ncbi:MAG: quinolinate synthase NadA [Candidatus Cloacimonadota bacterium]|nr:quinolinate synthase NadA [Candidatus Cloacimonadota bacterium]
MSLDKLELDKNKLKNFIRDKKKSLAGKVIIPAHHYQTQDIVDFADFVGDSYKLAVRCRDLDAKYIIFCGVRFMAEAANIVSKDFQKIIIPDLDSGCPLADKITYKEFEKAFNIIKSQTESEIVPVVYVNSSAEAKGFTGKNGGATCTSSNADKVVKYFLDKGKAVFFAPDFNLGINTSKKLNLAKNRTVKVNRDFSFEKLANVSTAKLFIWDGFCYVHKIFSVTDIKNLRAKYSKIKIIVHPECDREVLQSADYSGSTQQIFNFVKNSPSGSTWGIGTEYNFVKRLNDENPHKKVIPLRKSICRDMSKIDLVKLATSLQSIENCLNGACELIYEVKVPQNIKENAAIALNKMIEIVSSELPE